MECLTETVLLPIAIAVVVAFFFQALAWKRSSSKEKKRLPPGPSWGLPVVGDLLLLWHQPHQDLQKLAQKYGAIMRLRFGLMPVIMVSSAQAAELFLKTYDLVFASRPALEVAEYIGYNQQGLSSSPYGPYWRNVRKMCTLELLSNHKINSFKWMKKEEVCLFIESIKEAANNSVAVDLSAKVASLSSDMSYRMVLGKKYSDNEYEKGFKAVIREAMRIAATFNLSDFIPQIKFLDVQGLRKRMQKIAKVFDAFLEKIIEEHEHEHVVESKSESNHEFSKTNKDFVDVMLGFMGRGSQESEYRVERDTIKAIILDMLIASMDTSACAIEWTLSELIKHPTVMKKLQKEIENVVGMERMVEESDLEKLEYLNMVVKETLRLHPVVPLLLPHASTQDCTVNGFHIPKNSRICINAWAIGRDPNAWPDSDKFFPERFVASDIDLRGRDFELIPFGSGRRGCPGLQLGLTVVRHVVAQLVHCFDWELPNGMMVDELDMTEDFGLVCARANHLLAIPTWRLTKMKWLQENSSQIY